MKGSGGYPAWWRRRPRAGVLSLATVLAVLVTVAPPRAEAAPVAAAGASAQLSAALADPGRSVMTDWRADLAPVLAAMPQLRADRSVDGPVRGQVLAHMLRLPQTLELAGDTTMLAGEVTLGRVRPTQRVTVASVGVRS